MTIQLHYGIGGSYSGVYVPLLGEAILNGNEDGAMPVINLEVGWGGAWTI